MPPCPSSVKAVIYRCIVRPLLEYVASPVWYLYSPGDINLSLKQFNAERPDGSVAVIGMSHGGVGPIKSSDLWLQSPAEVGYST